MNNSPSDYFERRAKEEREAAEKAAGDRAAQSHLELARRYGRLARGEEQELGEDEVPDEPGAMRKGFRILP